MREACAKLEWCARLRQFWEGTALQERKPGHEGLKPDIQIDLMWGTKVILLTAPQSSYLWNSKKNPTFVSLKWEFSIFETVTHSVYIQQGLDLSHGFQLPL